MSVQNRCSTCANDSRVCETVGPCRDNMLMYWEAVLGSKSRASEYVDRLMENREHRPLVYTRKEVTR